MEGPEEEECLKVTRTVIAGLTRRDKMIEIIDRDIGAGRGDSMTLRWQLGTVEKEMDYHASNNRQGRS